MRFTRILILISAAGLAASGCQSAPEVAQNPKLALAPRISLGEADDPPPSPPQFSDLPPDPPVRLASFAAAADEPSFVPPTGANPKSANPLPEPIGGPMRSITLGEALAIALARNPDLLVSRQDLAIADAQRVTADTYPFNPTFEAQVQSANNTGLRQHIRQSYSLLQEVETGGKGQYRRGQALAGMDRVQWELRQRELELQSAVYLKFQALLNAARKIDLAHETTRLNVELAANARTLLNAGKVSGADLLIAEEEAIVTRQLEIAATGDRTVAELDLRPYWGWPTPVNCSPPAILCCRKSLGRWTSKRSPRPRSNFSRRCGRNRPP